MDDVDAIGVRAEFWASLNLKWDQPEGRPVNLGYIRRGGEVCTEATYWVVDDDLAEDYNLALARLFGGEVGGGIRRVMRPDGSLFRIEEVVDRLSEWRLLMEDFQDAIQARTREREG